MFELDKVDLEIREKLNMPISDDNSIYQNLDNRKKYPSVISTIVNSHVNKIHPCCDKNVLQEIKNDGYSVIENFLTQEQVDILSELSKNLKGYNFHVPNRAFDKMPQKFTNDLNWNVCSFKTNNLLANHLILNLILRPDVVSVAQEYMGCLPSIYSVNMWWSKFTGEEFHTQKLHRDYDDFKFLAFFIYLSDVDDDNGPHVYYKKTHNGSDDLSEKVIVKGKAGTAIFGDTFSLHHGQPLKSGQRLMFWSRYTMHIPNIYYRNKSYEDKLQSNMFFDLIDDTPENKHILRAFIK